MSAHRKDFDDEFLEKKQLNLVKNSLKNEFDRELVYYKKYLISNG